MPNNNNHEIYKDFLEYAISQGLDLEVIEDDYFSNDPMRQESHNIYDFEAAMYDFLGVQSVDDDDRLYPLLEAPGIYEINHPHNFRSKD